MRQGDLIIAPDTKDAPCAACGLRNGARNRRQVEGFLIMLCDDAAACTRRYRHGLQPAGYSALLKSGAKP